LVDEFLGFAHNSFEKEKAATCRFSKEFCKNPGNALTNRKEGNKIQKRIVNALPLFTQSLKEFCKFKSFWCSAAKNLLIKTKTKGRV
jgi:hypothetical protein